MSAVIGFFIGCGVCILAVIVVKVLKADKDDD